MTNKISTPPVAARNEVVDAKAWKARREACLSDPGAFHGALAKRHLAWLIPDQGEQGVWAQLDRDSGTWRGWDAKTAAP
ncbi:MAG: hypothetical protein P5678_26090, partial [Limnospira sp. PMC 1240.20]|uniref:hypothetical protein n=1 Tax=Limnospira sp. PMC 1240.20 TaxID=2981038 RepID=UPI0028E0DE42